MELRKLKDEEAVTDRQCNTMVKAKKDCGFNYLLSHKTVNKGSQEKEYITTLKCKKTHGKANAPRLTAAQSSGSNRLLTRAKQELLY